MAGVDAPVCHWHEAFMFAPHEKGGTGEPMQATGELSVMQIRRLPADPSCEREAFVTTHLVGDIDAPIWHDPFRNLAVRVLEEELAKFSHDAAVAVLGIHEDV